MRIRLLALVIVCATSASKCSSPIDATCLKYKACQSGFIQKVDGKYYCSYCGTGEFWRPVKWREDAGENKKYPLDIHPDTLKGLEVIY